MTKGQFKHYCDQAAGQFPGVEKTLSGVEKILVRGELREGESVHIKERRTHTLFWSVERSRVVYSVRREHPDGPHLNNLFTSASSQALDQVYEWEEAAGVSVFDDLGLEALLSNSSA